MPRQLFTSGIAVSAAQPEIRKRYNAQNEPYASTAQVFQDNDHNTFYLGQAFFVQGPNGIQEYWFESATASVADLVLKRPGTARIVDSIAALRGLDDLNPGDYIRTYGYHSGSDLGGGLFKVTTDEPLNFINLSGVAPDTGRIFVPNLTIDSEKTFKVKFNIRQGNGAPAIAPSTTVTLMEARNGSDIFRMMIRTNSAQQFDIRTGNSRTISIRTEFGALLTDDAFLDFNTWYELEIAPLRDAQGAPVTFLAGMILGSVNGAPAAQIDIERFDIMGFAFELNEGAGTVLETSPVSATQGEILLGGTWDTRNPTDDDALHITTIGGQALTKQLPNNTVTPFDFGAINNESVTDFVNDAQPAIQRAFDSGFNVEIPASRLYIHSSLNVTRDVHIRMMGSFVPGDDSNSGSTIQDEMFSTTILYSDQNIDYINIQSQNVKIYNGLLYTASAPFHDKAGIRFDIDFEMWRSDIYGLTVYGNKEALLSATSITNKTVAFKIDGEGLSKFGGYLTEARIEGRAIYCDTGVQATPIDDGMGAFVNSINFDVTGDGCRVFYDFAYGDLFKVSSVCQDRGVLYTTAMQEDPANTAFQFHNSNNCVYDVDLFDPEKTHHHGHLKYAISGDNITAKGALLTNYRSSGVELYGVESLDRYAIINDPIGLKITNEAGFISQFDNAVAFAGTEGHVSYRGYQAPDTQWFINNLHAAESGDNATPLGISPDVNIFEGEKLLTSDPQAVSAPRHTIANVANRDLCFAEIVLNDLNTMQAFFTSTLSQILLKTNGEKADSVQTILHFENGNIDYLTIAPSAGAGGLLNLFGYNKTAHSNSNIQTIIIRMIGQKGDGSTYVRDIGVKNTISRNKPLINIAGEQTIYGQHTIGEQLAADEYRYLDKPTSAGYGGEVLQLKEGANGAVGLYKLNTNDMVFEEVESGANVVLQAGQESAQQCPTTTTEAIDPSNGSIDVIYRFVNTNPNATEYTTRLYVNGVYDNVMVVKTIRGAEKIESISIPVSKSYPSGTEFSFTVTSNKNAQIGSASFDSKLRVTKSFLVPRPGAPVIDLLAGSTLTDVEAKVNELIGALRVAGFISPS